jgi:hypothetical protein
MDDTEQGSGDPIKFVNLLETPAEMQHMEMREWIKERISGKYGVTAIMMDGTPANSGLSQSMEVQVSNRSADRLRKIFNNVFVPAFLGQIGVEGWYKDVAEVEEEDERAEAEKQQRELQIAQQAAQLGLKVEWTKDNTASVKPGQVEMEEGGGMGGMGEMGDMLGDEGAEDPFGAEGQNQLDGVNSEGGGPMEDPKPAEDEGAFGRMAKKLADSGELELYNRFTDQWEKAILIDKKGDNVIGETESGLRFKIDEAGKVVPLE